MGSLQELILMLQRAFEQLNITVSLKVIEELAILIHKVMDADSRQYHRLEHAFDLSDPDDPYQSIAALFHDIISYQADMGFSEDIRHLLGNSVEEQDNGIWVTKQTPEDDRLFHLTLELFGFQQGQRFPSCSGMNEFLSSMVMHRAMRNILPEDILFQIAVYIEATIPFRGPDTRGRSFADIMFQRLTRMTQAHNLPFSIDDIECTIKRAVMFANTDVKGFAETNTGKFLDNTWKLMPETNVPLRTGELYTIQDYRHAIQKSEDFLNSLNPNNIFHQYHQVVPEDTLQGWVQQASKNLRIGREYLGIKLLAIVILEALAEETGGNAPLSLFTGDVGRTTSILQPPADIEVPVSFEPSDVVYILLDAGRPQEVNFDIRSSPISAFLYKYLEPEVRTHLLQQAKATLTGQLSNQEFLIAIDPKVLAVIVNDIALRAITRRDLLSQYTV
jgi:hypothetical protein